jgi:hypothetical protein
MTNKLFFNLPQPRHRIDFVLSAALRRLLFSSLAAALILAWPRFCAGADAPAWMHSAVNVPLPTYDEKTEAVVLYAEDVLSVQPNGKIKKIEKRAYKILRPDGRWLGKQRFFYDGETKITNIHGWCIPAQGKDFEVKEKEMTDTGYSGVEWGELYTDLHAKIMNIPAAEPGNIVGYEVEQDWRPYVMQDAWYFQDTMPVREARYTLQLPPSWEYKAVWLNHLETAPSSAGNGQYQWVVSDLQPIKWEAEMPPWRGVAGLMILSLFPPGGGNRGFVTWADMGQWYNQLLRGRRDLSPEIHQQVATLTGSVNGSLAKMRALAEFLQKDIRYVAVELGVGGFQPHPARDVFTHRFGDCKDKATLLSAMLSDTGIESYYVVIHTERGGVTASTPPHLEDFNHVILAIKLPNDVQDSTLTATLQHPKLGRLLFFDPTDTLTPFGSLRGPLQSNYGLLVTPEGGELLELPQLSPSTGGTQRTAKLALNAQGTLSGEFVEWRVGDSARRQRYALRSVSKDADRIKPIEQLMSHSLGTFHFTKATVSNVDYPDRPFGYDYSIVAENYAKSAGNLMLVRPRVVGEYASGILEQKELRKYPVEFDGPAKNSDMFEITLPAGYEVDDLPPAVDVDYEFASYHSKTEAAGNTLKYSRTFEVKELSVPLSKVDDLKKLYRIIASDERNTAVLKPAAH